MTKKDTAGFTITELMFAMTFLSVLLLILLGSIIQITRTYNKGITMKRVNQSGRTLGEEMTRSLQQANPKDVVYKANNGRLCLGSYSYVWNIEPTEESPGITSNVYQGDGQKVNFVKVEDPGKVLCTDTLPPVQKDKAKELLGDGLVARDPTAFNTVITESTATSNNSIVTMRYTVSTPENDLFDETGRCKGGAGDDFCALNTFDVTVYTKGN